MIDNNRPDGSAMELAKLVSTLHETQQRIQKLTGGAVDAVLDQLSGATYLLPNSQAYLHRSEAEQRHYAVERAAILNALSAHIALIDRNGLIVTVNDAWRDFARANALIDDDFAIGRNYIEICEQAHGLGSSEARAVAIGLQSVLKGMAKDFVVEYPCHSPTEQRWFRLMVTPLGKSLDGGAVAMHIDVTERKLAVDALLVSEERFRSTFRDAVIGMAITDAAGRFLEANTAYCQTLGYTEDELRTLRFEDITHPDDRANNLKLNDELIRNERRSFSLEKRYLAKDGHPVWCRVSVSAARDAAGGVVGTISIAEDISKRKLAEDLRDETESRFRQLANAIEDAFWLVAPDESVLYLSPAFERIWGISMQALLDDPLLWLKSVLAEDRPMVVEALKGQAWGVYDVEYRILRPDGEVRWIADRGFPIRDEAGRIQRTAGTSRDITAHKRSERSLIESEERFQLLSRATNDAIWDWDRVTGSLWWNEGFETLFGFKRGDVEPTIESWKSRVHPEDFARVDRASEPGVDNWSAEYRFRRKDGGYAYVLDRGYIIRDSAGKPVRMIGGMTDLTERKRSEERLAEQAALLDVVQEAILVRGIDHRVQFWNRSAERIYGWVAAEVIGRLSEDLLYDDPTDFRRATAVTLERGHWTGRLAQRRKDGSKLVVQSNWVLVRDGKGAPLSILAVHMDITVRLGLEEQLRQSQRLEAVGQLTGGIAHDFNNLLTVILGNAELLVEELRSNVRLRGLAEMTKFAAQRGAELTQHLLAFARRQALEPRVVDVNRLLKSMDGLLRRTLTASISIDLAYAQDLCGALVDPAQLENAILNLCLNARDAMKDGGKLTIETANAYFDIDYIEKHPEVTPGPYVMVAVSDTGTGIPADIIDAVFDPFFTTKESGKGTGLGLSMVYGFAKQSDGHVKIYSEVGQGTSVKIYLPRGSGKWAQASDALAVVPIKGGSETILMVEDDDGVRTYVESQLLALGYNVLTANNGMLALDLVRQHPEIELLFTDVIMPGGMNGRQLADAARQIRPALGVLYTSGYSKDAIMHQGRLDPGINLLSKPYLRSELARMIRIALDSGPAGAS